MSSLLDISVPLALILQLAAADPGAGEPPREHAIASCAAAGSISYSDGRWLDVLQRHGAEVGEGMLAGRVFRTRSGLVYVPVAEERAAVLARRRDGALVHSLTRLAASSAAAWIAAETGRRASMVDLYLAHIAPRSEARALIAAVASDLVRPASELAPETALAHRSLFFAGSRAVSVAELQRHVDLAVQRALRDARQTPDTSGSCGDDGWKTVTVRWTAGNRHASR